MVDRVTSKEQRAAALDALLGMLSARGVSFNTMHFLTSPLSFALLRQAAAGSWSSGGNRAPCGHDHHLAGRNRMVTRICRVVSSKREELKKACEGVTVCILSDASSGRRMFITNVMVAGVPGFPSPQLVFSFVDEEHYNSESKALQLLVSMVAYDIHFDQVVAGMSDNASVETSAWRVLCEFRVHPLQVWKSMEKYITPYLLAAADIGLAEADVDSVGVWHKPASSSLPSLNAYKNVLRAKAMLLLRRGLAPGRRCPKWEHVNMGTLTCLAHGINLCCGALVDGLSAIKENERLVMDVSGLLSALRTLAKKPSFSFALKAWRVGKADTAGFIDVNRDKLTFVDTRQVP
jgi:hypothetical protein